MATTKPKNETETKTSNKVLALMFCTTQTRIELDQPMDLPEGRRAQIRIPDGTQRQPLQTIRFMGENDRTLAVTNGELAIIPPDLGQMTFSPIKKV